MICGVWRGQSVNGNFTLQPIMRVSGDGIAGAGNPAMAPTNWTMSKPTAFEPLGQGHRWR